MTKAVDTPATATPGETIVHAVRRHALLRPHDEAFVFLHNEGAQALQRLTFAQLDRLAGAVGGALRDGPGPVLLVFEPGLEFVVAFLGCLYAGRPAVPVRPPRCAADVEWLERVAGIVTAGCVLLDGASRERLEQLGASRELLDRTRTLDWLTDAAAVDEHARRRPHTLPAGDAVAFVQFTSGSTGSPRGVVVQHANIVDNQRVIAAAFGHDAETSVVGWLPHYHDMGLLGIVLQPAFLGRPCRLMSPTAFLQRPMRWLRAISELRHVTSGGPNFAFQHCVRAISQRELERGPRLDLSGWRLAFVGAEPVRVATMNAFAERFAEYGFRREALYPCYGLAEATLMVAGGQAGHGVRSVALDRAELDAGRVQVVEDGDGAARVVACGVARGDNTLRIVDPETQAPLPPQHVGEVWASGPSVAAGYFGDGAATAQRFEARLLDGDDRRWLRTGDLGFVHDGQLFVTGRLHSLIVLNGRKLYPQDLEDSLARLHPSFRAGGAAAFTVPTETGARLVVVQEVRGQALAQIEPAHVLRTARALLSTRFGVHLDDLVLTTDTISRTSSGKIRHHDTRQRYLGNDFGRVAEARVEVEHD